MLSSPKEGETIEYREDRLAFTAIFLQSVPLEMLALSPPSAPRNRLGRDSNPVGLVQRVRESSIETEIVKKMLQVVPDHIEQVAISIESLLDVNDLVVEEVTERLRNADPIQCSNCGKRGHLSKNCWSKLRNKERQHQLSQFN